MMKNSMALPSEEVAEALVAAGLSPESRAQDLSLDDFVAVHHSLRAGAKE
jgi:16S rRNA A1518/A1519 N6-dimethyltransferase RsmA/KsgA/DIM1 with predicted DNA glycosylase/AP lyase activity